MEGWGEEAVLSIKNIGRLQGHQLGIPLHKPHDTFFSDWPSICGGATPPSGYATSPFKHLSPEVDRLI